MAGRSRTAEVDRLRRVYDDYDRDPHARRRWSLDNPGNRAVHAERARRSAELLRGVPGPVLDLGCGTGQVLAELAPALDPSRVRLGVDLSASRLSEGARRRPEASFVRAEGSELPLPDEGVGLVLAYTLFS